MAPTDVTFNLSPSGETIPYNYSVNYSPVKGVDVLGRFVDSCQKRQIRTGFYYTVVTNTWLNVENGFVNRRVPFVSSSHRFFFQVQNRTLAPGQMNISQSTYDSIVLQQLREIWTRYGKLDEIWFDGGSVSFLVPLSLSLLTRFSAR